MLTTSRNVCLRLYSGRSALLKNCTRSNALIEPFGRHNIRAFCAKRHNLRAFREAFVFKGESTEEEIARWEKTGSGTSHHDFIEEWNQNKFIGFGVGMSAGTLGLFYAMSPASVVAPCIAAAFTAVYWVVGFRDMRQTRHALRRNFPVLGNIRYFAETLRPIVRQYFVESDEEGVPFSRDKRSIVYARAKNMTDTLPLGTHRQAYEVGYEWALHSMFPKHVSDENSRVMIGESNPHCTQPYSASLLNISAMSYGALSANAVLALNNAAKKGGFYHNTGEGGISRFHKQPGGDIVWNVGTGYFGCGKGSLEREFDPDLFQQNAKLPQVKMIEVKLSQGAKPAHGGLLPKEKITPEIAEARGLEGPPYEDCNSPPYHSAFDDADGLIAFIQRLQSLSGGKPVGMKLCIGRPDEFVELASAMARADHVPDFITVDGGEGGTGAAPPEFSNSVGMPLREGLYMVHNILTATGLRKRTKLIASGKILSGFSLVTTLALGADLCNSARAMMFALGCIQSLKCNTNTCPTGITTHDPDLMSGLVVGNKSVRVARFQHATVESALEIIGAMGLTDPTQVEAHHIMRRVSDTQVLTLKEMYPHVPEGCLIKDGAEHFVDKMDIAHDGRVTVEEFRQFVGNEQLADNHILMTAAAQREAWQNDTML